MRDGRLCRPARHLADHIGSLALKSNYDPSNFFRSSQNIQPAA
ncbi:MAG TPA: BBE domain-containing protein [Candidatus Binatus sp.]|nr:BBE domain-containing protein [Candidatus Binatus sp.]